MKLKIGKPEESNVHAFYNMVEGIKKSLESYESFLKLIHERHVAGYEREERLTEFYVLGNFYLDSCGNIARALINSKGNFPNIPDVLTSEAFWEYIKKNSQNNEISGMGFGFSPPIPPIGACCIECKESWDLETIYDVISHSDSKVVSLEKFKGQKLAVAIEFFNSQDDAIWLMNQPDSAIRNDDYIDLTSRSGQEEWNLKYPENQMVENEHGWLKLNDLSDNYLVRAGDEAFFNIYKYYHKSCYQMKLNLETSLEFLDIFKAAGFIPEIIATVRRDNEYGSYTYRGPWFDFHTELEKPIRIGWRKRVMEIEWSNWKVDLNQLFKEEQTTSWEYGVHAWTKEKAIEYLKKIREELQKTN